MSPSIEVIPVLVRIECHKCKISFDKNNFDYVFFDFPLSSLLMAH